MSTTPAGLPIWTRTAAIEQYGGDLNKRDWGDLGAVDALTDVTAAQLCRLTADLAGVARVAKLGRIVIGDTNARSKTVSSPADIQVISAECLWGIAPGAYQGNTPSTGFPSVVVTTTIYGWGYEVDFGASQTDDYGASAAIAIKGARVECNGGFLEAVNVTWSGSKVSFCRTDGTDKWTGAATITVTAW